MRYTPCRFKLEFTICVLITCFLMPVLEADCQESMKPKPQNILKISPLALINPFYPELQLGYGYQKSNQWAIHLTGSFVYDYGTFSESSENAVKYGFRSSISLRKILTQDPAYISEWFVGLRGLHSSTIRKKADFFWDEEFNFQQYLEIKGITDGFTLFFDGGVISNNNKRFALEVLMGLGAKTYRRRHPGIPPNISPRPLYNFFERGHITSRWRTVPSWSFQINLVYRLGKLPAG